jgi:hypothetical protein
VSYLDRVEKTAAFGAKRPWAAAMPRLDWLQAIEETVRAIAMPDRPAPWTTVEERIEQELMLALSGDEQPGPRDWYQDSRAVTLPRECMPQWRTRH